MSDVYIPGRSRGSSFGPTSEITRLHQLDLNQNLITTANPWLAQDPETLFRLATSGADPEMLTQNAAAMAGMESLDRVAANMRSLSPIAQRSVYGKMTEQQQRGLNQMGFQIPQVDEPSSLDPLFGTAAGAIGTVMSPVKSVVGAPLGKGLDLLTWIGDVPAHFYRSIRQMDDWQQWLSAAAAAATVAAVIASRGRGASALQGMGTFQTLGALGGAGLGSATIATAPTLVSNPTEWWDLMNPFGDTGVGRGERIFTADAQRRSRELLGNSTHIDALARDIAADLDTYDLVLDVAGNRDATSQDVLLESIERVAGGLADPGTEEFQRVYAGLIELTRQPEFMAAVDELQKSKISFGRDIAGAFGLEQGDQYHSLVSGAADGLWLFAMDPLLIAGSGAKLVRTARRGLDLSTDTALITRLSEMVASDKAVRASADQIGAAIRREDFTMLPKAWRSNHTHLTEWKRQALARGEQLADDDAGLFMQYLDDGRGMTQLMKGHGTVRGQELIRMSTGADSVGMGRFVKSIRQFQRGLTDQTLVDDLHRQAERFGVTADLEHMLPRNAMDEAIDTQFAKKTLAELDETGTAYRTGAALGQTLMIVPGGRTVGNFISSISTMIPANSAIALTDMGGAGLNNAQNATTDIPRFIETFGRHFNLPSFVRDEWLNVTMRQGTVAQRRQVLLSFMDSTFTAGGLKSTDEGARLVDEFIMKYKQSYGFGGVDNVRIGDTERIVGLLPDQHQAVFMVMPDLRKMSDVVRQGHVLKNVAKVTDSNFVEASMSRFIKPGWLLRIGFIPRAAGEEMLAFMMRMSEGGFLQEFGARSLAQGNAASAARTKLLKEGREALSRAEIDALRYRTVSHIRPMTAMSERIGWQRMDQSFLNRYSDWIRRSIDDGLGWTWTENLPTWADNILLGKDQSLRHMIANGVDPNLKLAADRWVTRHASAVMRSTSAQNASIAEKAIVNPESQRMMIPDGSNPGARTEKPVVMTGERGLAGVDDLRYDNGVHHQVGEVFRDEVVGPAWAEALSTYLPENMQLTEVEIADALDDAASLATHTGRQLALELVDVREDNVRAVAQGLRNRQPEVADAIVDSLRHGELDLELLRKNMDEVVAVATAKQSENARQYEALVGDLDSLEAIVMRTADLGDQERAWIGTALSRQLSSGGSAYDTAAIRAGVNDVVQGRPDFVLYRGMPDSSGMRINENGDLVLFAQNQAQWAKHDADAVSLTTSIEEAMTFAGKRADGMESAMSGAVLEIDGSWMLQNQGIGMDDLNKTPMTNYSQSLTRGDGPYFYGHNPEDPMTEVAFVMQRHGRGAGGELVIPKNKWRFQTTDDMQSAIAGADTSTRPGFTMSSMKTEIGGRPVDDVVEQLDTRIDEVIDSMSPAEQAELADALNENRADWSKYYSEIYTNSRATRPDSLSMVESLAPEDEVGQAVVAKLNQLREEFGSIAPELEQLSMSASGHIIDDAIRERLGLDLARVLDPSSQGGYDGAKSAAQLSQMRAGTPLRGQGGFHVEATQQWSPIHRDFKKFEEGLQAEVAKRLADPNNTQFVKRADRLLNMPDGSPIARPPADGLANVYTPVVPAETTRVLSMLEGTEISSVYDAEVVAKLAGLQHGASHRSIETIELMAASIPQGLPIENDLQRVLNLANEIQVGIDSGADVGSKWDDMYELVDGLDEATTRPESYGRIADRLMQRAEARSIPMEGLEQVDVADLRAALASALDHIDRNRGAYSQPVSLALESMGFNNPSVARWITHMLSDTLDTKLPTTVGHMQVPRQAVLKGGQRGHGVRLGSETTAGQYWQLDSRYATKATPREARQVHMRPRIETNPITGNEVETMEYNIGATLEEGIAAWARDIVDGTLNKQRRGVKSVQKLKPGEGRNQIARRVGSEYEVLDESTELAGLEDLFEVDEAGKLLGDVQFGDNRYFDAEVVESTDELMWGIVGPMARDHFEASGGFTRVVPKDVAGNKAREVGVAYDPESYVRMTRSRVDDVRREPSAALPNSTIVENYRTINDGIWDRIVRYGFDNVIGPSIDALARKPMSFHYYSQAFMQNRRQLGWLLDNDLFDRRIVDELGDAVSLIEEGGTIGPDRLDDIKTIARELDIDLDGATAKEGREFLLGLAEDQRGLDAELQQISRRARRQLEMEVVAANPNLQGRQLGVAIEEAVAASANDAVFRAAERLASNSDRGILSATTLDVGIGSNSPGQRFVNAYLENIPTEVWDDGLEGLQTYVDANRLALPTDFTEDQFKLLDRARKNLGNAMDQADESAAVRAIENVVPFLDSHEERSMFAEYGRNFIPFWYAEENFIKRWSRTLTTSDLLGIDMVRKAQLQYMGLRSAGIVRTDESGNDWVVYPGSGLLNEAVAKVLPGDLQPIGVMFQANTESLLPGVNSNFGGASPSPFIAMPVHALTAMFPDAQDAKRELLGDVGGSRNPLTQFVPTAIQRGWEVMFMDETSSARYGSAMATAIAYNEAHGNGLPDGATPAQADEYLDRIRNHARIIMVSQMFAGFVSPGSPQAIATGESASSWEALAGVGLDDPAQVTSALYREYITNAGIEEGTSMFLEAFPHADLEDVVNPLAFTTSKSESPSRAPLPATRIGMEWYNQNSDWVNELPEAGAWFLPQDDEDAEFDYYSYSQQLASGLRKQRTPEEFLRAIKFRQGADVYFEERDMYEAALQRAGDNRQQRQNVENIWSIWKNQFLTANPIFHEELLSGDARERRHRAIEQLRYASSDPLAPDSPYTSQIRAMSESYDSYRAQLLVLADRRDQDAESRKRQIKAAFGEWVEGWKLRNPQLQRLWSTVYQPEAGLD